MKIQWMKDRKDLNNSSSKISFADGVASLEVMRVSKNDAGDYLCKATNEAGSEFCKAKVTIKGTRSGPYFYSNHIQTFVESAVMNEWLWFL